jgi:hypothetical protein
MSGFKITITPDLAPYDGEYLLELPFTNDELHALKKLTGIRAGEIGEALDALDNDLCVAFAHLALEREGKTHSLRKLWAATTGSIKLDVVDEEGDEDVPPEKTATTPDEPGSETATSDEPMPSGPGSPSAGDHPESDLPRTGSQP